MEKIEIIVLKNIDRLGYAAIKLIKLPNGKRAILIDESNNYEAGQKVALECLDEIEANVASSKKRNCNNISFELYIIKTGPIETDELTLSRLYLISLKNFCEDSTVKIIRLKGLDDKDLYIVA